MGDGHYGFHDLLSVTMLEDTNLISMALVAPFMSLMSVGLPSFSVIRLHLLGILLLFLGGCWWYLPMVTVKVFYLFIYLFIYL